MSWWQLKVFLRHRPADSAFIRQVDPERIWQEPQYSLMVKLIDAQRPDGMTPLWDHLYGASAPEDDLEPEDAGGPDVPSVPVEDIDIRAEIAARRAAAQEAAA